MESARTFMVQLRSGSLPVGAACGALPNGAINYPKLLHRRGTCMYSTSLPSLWPKHQGRN
jgi:hypothetical protein